MIILIIVMCNINDQLLILMCVILILILLMCNINV